MSTTSGGVGGGVVNPPPGGGGKNKAAPPMTADPIGDSKLNVIVELKASQTGPVMLLDQVSRSLTDGLWMTELELEEGEVRMQGASLSEASVADFVNNLERSEYFADVRLRTLLDTGEQSNFQITLVFDPTPGTDAQAGAQGGTD